jgi:bifunctional DNA-binding transcriptional regulator/antitoxin component of YhaV-PrlF toxin-antitoxin module
MQQTTFQIKLSTKNQFTFPVALIKKMGWHTGQIFNVSTTGKVASIQTSEDVLSDINDIVSKYNLPSVSIEEAIEYTKAHNQKERFNYED